MLQHLLIGNIDTLVAVAPETVQRHALVGLRAVAPQRRTAVQFRKCVLQVTDVSADVVVHLPHRVIVVQRYLHTLVTDVTHILHRATPVAHMRRRVHIQKRVQRVPAEIVHTTAQASVPEAEVDTRVPLLVGLPFAVLVRQRQQRRPVGDVIIRGGYTQRIAVEHLVAALHHLYEDARGYTVVTHLTVTRANLDVVQPTEFQIAQKRLLAQAPCQRKRGEETPRLLGELA